MKNLVKVVTCFVLLMSFSCDKDDTVFAETDELESTNLTLTKTPKMLAQIVQGPNCRGIKRLYTVYATQFTGSAVNYNREVSILITRNNQIIDGGVVTIPANKRVSNNIPILNHVSPVDGTVGIRVTGVKRAGQDISDEFTFVNQTNVVNSCGRVDLTGPGLSPCGSEGKFDEDGDGICDFADPDFQD